MKKLILFCSLFFVLTFCAAGENKYLKTNWFEIIFPDVCENSALRLSEYADEVYLDLCSQFDVKPFFKVRVCLVPDTDVFNAYFSELIRTHIILYDTMPDEDMAVFSDSLKSTFTHELTHHVSLMQYENPDSTKVLGDFYNPGNYIYLTPMLAESATVYSESVSGEGRLNDGYFLQTLKQAKINKKFPNETQVTGARTVRPSGASAYSFGGPFAEYLIEKYGREKYNQIFHDANSVLTTSYRRLFKNIYEKKFKDEWKEFESWIDIPDVKNNLNEFEKTQKNQKSFYSCFSQSKNSFVYYNESNKKVYKVDENLNQKKLFSNSYIFDLNMSLSGNYILAGYYDEKNGRLVKKYKIYDVQKKHLKSIDVKNLSSCALIESDGKNFIYGVNTYAFNSGKLKFQIYEIKKNKCILVKEKYFDEKSFLYSVNQIDEKNISFIYIKDMQWTFVKSDLMLEELNSYDLPKNIRGRNLNRYGDFSFVDGKSLPRYGKFDFENEKLILMTEDFSGGIYNPVCINNQILYKANFYDEEKILLLNLNEIKFNEIIIEKRNNLIEEKQEIQTVKSNEIKKNYDRGDNALVPFSYINSLSADYDYRMENDDEWKNGISTGVPLLAGLSWFWGDNLDNNFFLLAAGTSVFEYGAGFLWFSRDTEGLWSSLLNLGTVFEKDEFNNASLSLELSKVFLLGNISNFGITLNNTGIISNNENNFTWFDSNNFGLSIGNIHKTGSGTFEKTGFSFGVNFINVETGKFDDSLWDYLFLISPAVKFNIPKIIPVHCKNYMTYNFPLSIYASLIPDYNYYLTLSGEMVLFGTEIQNGLGWIPLYFHNLSVTASWLSALTDTVKYDSYPSMKNLLDDFKDGNFSWVHQALLNFYIRPSINTGYLCTLNIDINLFGGVIFNDEKVVPSYGISLKSAL